MDNSPIAAENWLRKAHEDLEMAALAQTRADLRGQVCFHAQQALEKALKGAASHLGVRDIPKTHDVTALADVVGGQGAEVPVTAEELEAFDSYAVDVRYEDLVAPDEQAATMAVALARQVYDWAEGLIKPK